MRYSVHSPALAGQPYQLNETRGRFDHNGDGDVPVDQKIRDEFDHYEVLTFREIQTVGQKVAGAVETVKQALTGKKNKKADAAVPETDPEAELEPNSAEEPETDNTETDPEQEPDAESTETEGTAA